MWDVDYSECKIEIFQLFCRCKNIKIQVTSLRHFSQSAASYMNRTKSNY